MAKQNEKNHPVVLLTVYLAARKRGDHKKANLYRTKLAAQGIRIEGDADGQ